GLDERRAAFSIAGPAELADVRRGGDRRGDRDRHRDGDCCEQEPGSHRRDSTFLRAYRVVVSGFGSIDRRNSISAALTTAGCSIWGRWPADSTGRSRAAG